MPADEQTSRDLDAPTPPGSPMRRDAPDGDVMPGTVGTSTPTPPEPSTPAAPDTPGTPEIPGPEPSVLPSSTPDGPQTIPSPSTPPGEPGPDPAPETQPDPTGRSGPASAQLENAASSLDQPSDASGAE